MQKTTYFAREGGLAARICKSWTLHADFTFSKDDRLLLGRESAGVPEYVHESVDDAVTIEMPGKGRSLNIVVSCVMVLSEAIRQTRDL